MVIQHRIICEYDQNGSRWGYEGNPSSMLGSPRFKPNTSLTQIYTYSDTAKLICTAFMSSVCNQSVITLYEWKVIPAKLCYYKLEDRKITMSTIIGIITLLSNASETNVMWQTFICRQRRTNVPKIGPVFASPLPYLEHTLTSLLSVRYNDLTFCLLNWQITFPLCTPWSPILSIKLYIAKTVPLHAAKALGGRSIAPTHSGPRQ
jgi:hypothetical protein